MKRLIPFFLAFLMLLSLCGCRGSFGSIDLQDAIEIPEDGIVKKSTIEQIKDKNAIAAFYGESNGCKYEWTIFGSDVNWWTSRRIPSVSCLFPVPRKMRLDFLRCYPFTQARSGML